MNALLYLLQSFSTYLAISREEGYVSEKRNQNKLSHLSHKYSLIQARGIIIVCIRDSPYRGSSFKSHYFDFILEELHQSWETKLITMLWQVECIFFDSTILVGDHILWCWKLNNKLTIIYHTHNLILRHVVCTYNCPYGTILSLRPVGASSTAQCGC